MPTTSNQKPFIDFSFLLTKKVEIAAATIAAIFASYWYFKNRQEHNTAAKTTGTPTANAKPELTPTISSEYIFVETDNEKTNPTPSSAAGMTEDPLSSDMLQRARNSARSAVPPPALYQPSSKRLVETEEKSSYTLVNGR